MSQYVKLLNRSMLLASAPFVGIMAWLLMTELSLSISPDIPKGLPSSVGQNISQATAETLDSAAALAKSTQASIKKQVSLYEKTNADIRLIAATASAQARRPLTIYDTRITRKLGTTTSKIETSKLRAQLFSIQAQHFSGYALKVKLGSKDAMKMVLGNDTYGGSETTMSAVKRYDASVGINAGGFADGRGKRYPLSTTMMNGKFLNGFEPSHADLFFVGMSEDNKLIGGKFSSKEQLEKLNPNYGASFVPVLMKDSRSTLIPLKWQLSPKRAPRTVIANYKDDQLLFIVVDGYNENGSSGATLEEMQILLQRFGAVDAYNLDGGGSSSLVFNGRVVNNPSDGRLRSLPTHFLFFD